MRVRVRVHVLILGLFYAAASGFYRFAYDDRDGLALRLCLRVVPRIRTPR